MCNPCTKRRACEILGQCVYKHPFIEGDAAAIRDLQLVSKLEDVVKVFCKHTKERVVIGSQRRKGNIVYPNQYQLTSKRTLEAMQKSTRREAVKQYKSTQKSITIDPVTMRLYKLRMKRVADADVSNGYVYDERERKDFHI